jgi:hypothetical protein
MGNPENIAGIGYRVQVGTKKIRLKTHIHQELRALENTFNRTVVVRTTTVRLTRE